MPSKWVLEKLMLLKWVLEKLMLLNWVLEKCMLLAAGRVNHTSQMASVDIGVALCKSLRAQSAKQPLYRQLTVLLEFLKFSHAQLISTL
jgi:hypothetical protein